VQRIGVGAGGRDPEGFANALRLFLGVSTDSTSGVRGETVETHGTEAPVLVETNVDDLDPRLWPNVIAALIDAGASDAWLTPILMKKGRPAHTLSALVTSARLGEVRTEIFRQTSTIGLRETPVGKTALQRETRTIVVGGEAVRVKLAVHDGQVVNAQPEYDDVARAAAATGRPVKDVLADAVAASRKLPTD
jgi:uncharacterized protein (DUF111 family)